MQQQNIKKVLMLIGPKLASLFQKICTLWFHFFEAFLASKGHHFKNIFDFTTAGDWDRVAVVERLHALHYSVDFISCPLGSLVSLWNSEIIRGSLMRHMSRCQQNKCQDK